jgi:hypothetical protein
MVFRALVPVLCALVPLLCHSCALLCHSCATLVPLLCHSCALLCHPCATLCGSARLAHCFPTQTCLCPPARCLDNFCLVRCLVRRVRSVRGVFWIAGGRPGRIRLTDLCAPHVALCHSCATLVRPCATLVPLLCALVPLLCHSCATLVPVLCGCVPAVCHPCAPLVSFLSLGHPQYLVIRAKGISMLIHYSLTHSN